MDSEVATLQSIVNTLEEEPLASLHLLTENASISIDLINAVFKHFVERGWIMLSNVNLRKLSCAITPEGIAELTARSQKFAKYTFALANQYNEKLCNLIAKAQGKNTFYLYGQSCIKFFLIYVCQIQNVTFIEKETDVPIDKDAFCAVGEVNDEETIKPLEEKGCLNLLNLINAGKDL